MPVGRIIGHTKVSVTYEVCVWWWGGRRCVWVDVCLGVFIPIGMYWMEKFYLSLIDSKPISQHEAGSVTSQLSSFHPLLYKNRIVVRRVLLEWKQLMITVLKRKA